MMGATLRDHGKFAGCPMQLISCRGLSKVKVEMIIIVD